MKTIRSVKQTALRRWNHSVCLILAYGPGKKKFQKSSTFRELVQALSQDPKFLRNFHVARFHVVPLHGCRLPIVFVPPHVNIGVGM